MPCPNTACPTTFPSTAPGSPLSISTQIPLREPPRVTLPRFIIRSQIGPPGGPLRDSCVVSRPSFAVPFPLKRGVLFKGVYYSVTKVIHPRRGVHCLEGDTLIWGSLFLGGGLSHPICLAFFFGLLFWGVVGGGCGSLRKAALPFTRAPHRAKCDAFATALPPPYSRGRTPDPLTPHTTPHEQTATHRFAPFGPSVCLPLRDSNTLSRELLGDQLEPHLAF